MIPRARKSGVRFALPLAITIIVSIHLPTLAHASGFSHGVAAGDATFDSAVLWSRADFPGPIRVELFGDESLETIIQTIEPVADQANNATIKVDISSLSPGTEYFYRFVRQDDPAVTSRIGRFRTAPPPDAPAGFRFIFSGDSSFAFSPFTLMSHAAREDADFFIWYGDTICADSFAGRINVAFTLDEYRGKYKEIRGDPHVQDLLAGLAVWTGWDDHEVLNNYAGLDPDLPSERRDAAYQAFFEFMPIRRQGHPEDAFRTYRRFGYGSQAEFFILDGRQYREPPAGGPCEADFDPLGLFLGPITADPVCQELLAAPRSMLGNEQFNWLCTGLAESKAEIKFIVNNVPMSHIGVMPTDSWDGYDAERRRLLEFIDANKITGVVILTTDMHANVHNPDLTYYFRTSRLDYLLDNHIAVTELIVGPVGAETLRKQLLVYGASYLGLPLDSFTQFILNFLMDEIVARLRRIDGLAFVADDYLAYAVVDVSPEGRVNVTYRGLEPNETQDPNADIQTLYTSPVIPTPSPPIPCCWPLLFMLGGMLYLPRSSRHFSLRFAIIGPAGLSNT